MFGVKVESDSLRQQIGQAIIDQILKRTEEPKSVNGHKFIKYSDKYIKSDDFKAFGKDPNKVNLRLTGDMLDLMDILDDSPTHIEIGWTDTDEALKASGHIKGLGPLPKRDFFGLMNKEIEAIAKEFKSELKTDDTSEEGNLLESIRNIVNGERES